MASVADVVELTWVREALPAAGVRLHRLLDQAVEVADLASADVFMLRDWVDAVPSAQRDNLGLLLVALFLALDDGSLSVELSPASLSRRLADLIPETILQPWIAEAIASICRGELAVVVGTADEHRQRPVLIWANGERRFLYFQKYLRAEQDLDARLQERLEREPVVRSLLDLARVLNDVLVTAPLKPSQKSPVLDADQKTALGLALIRDLVLISGGPGTGKTSIVLNVLRCLARLGVAPERIALAAPTGRAAQRLSDSLRAGLATLGAETAAVDQGLAELKAVTLHQLLDYVPHRNLVRRHEENPIPAEVVIVDEVSMVSVEQMARLLRALEPSAKLLLLGDKDQLPSVEAGAVLGQLVDDLDAPSLSQPVTDMLRRLFPDELARAVGMPHRLRDAVAFLRTNHRSNEGIKTAAQAMNRQDVSVLERLSKLPVAASETTPGYWQSVQHEGGCWWWEQTRGNVAELRSQLHRWAEHVYAEPVAEGLTFLEAIAQANEAEADVEEPETKRRLGRVFQALDRTRLLTLVREGPWGCRLINEMLDDWLRRHGGAGRAGGFVPGTPLLVTRNDKSRELFNGDVGLVLDNRMAGRRVVFARRNGFVALAPESLPSHELGFAITVHKSQGSEFEQTLLVMPPSGGRRLLTKELLYTAVTRAKELAIISATAEALKAAIERKMIRESGLHVR